MFILAIDVGSLSKGDYKREGGYMGMLCESNISVPLSSMLIS